jgi:predicted metal-binding membrane protein
MAWHPEWWVYAVAGVSWFVLAWMSAEVAMSHGGFVAEWSQLWTYWVLMVLAMMLPVIAPHVRTVGLRSLWSRRHRSMLFHLLGYLAVWAGAGALLEATLVLLGLGHHGSHLLPAALLLAAAWQVSAPRRRVLRRCASLRLRASAGLGADVDCARAGLRSGLRCLVECWPVMLAMALSHSLVLMAGLTVVLLTERARGANPVRRAGRPLEAWALAAFAFAALVPLVM